MVTFTEKGEFNKLVASDYSLFFRKSGCLITK